MVSTNILLGAVAGVTIFFGLLIARWRNASERLRGLLALASAGVLLFLIIEVGFRAMETVEAVSFGTTLVIGFALHNATEGFGIAGPLVGTTVSWERILLLGLIGGGPTVLGAVIGGVWVSPWVELLFLSLAMGSLIYVTRELFRIRFQSVDAVAAMTAIAVGIFIGFGTELIAEVAQSRATIQATAANAVTVRFANKQASPASLSLARGQSLTIENGDNVPLVFEGNGLFVGEVVVPSTGRITVAATGREGQYRLVDERGQSAVADIIVQPGEAVEPLTDEVNAVGALTVLEGHVRASKELHDRGVSKQGPDPALDLKRAGKHAGHPQHELLMGGEPDALNLQKLLRARSVFDSVNNALTAYVKISGDGSVSKDEIERAYQSVLTTTEEARRAIESLSADSRSAFDKLLNEVFSTLDPSDPNRPVPVSEVKALIEQAERGFVTSN